jgi:flagellar motor switch protein FliG
MDLIIEQAVTLTSRQKAAVILVTLGPDAGKNIIDKIDDIHLKNFISALESLREVPRETLLAAIADFIILLEKKKGVFRAGPKRAHAIASELLDSERVGRLLDTRPKTNDFGDPTQKIWEDFSKKPIESIADFIRQQRLEVGGIIMRELPVAIAGEVLNELNDDLSVTYVSELSKDSSATAQARKAVAELIKVEFLTSGEASGEKSEAIGYVANLLSAVSRNKRVNLLTKLDKSNADQARKIRNQMLTYEDLAVRLPPSAAAIIFKEMDKSILLEALQAGAKFAPDTNEFLLANISQRMADGIREEVAELPESSQKDGEKAVSKLMNFVGRLEAQKRITLAKKPID